ncbi:hypothetical protein M0R45_000459 [Rubus argutus]|uniref:Uncharacterized protein n=1 Tax=Rubus argutus TaxID=59490 RepID=A0AAW1VLQ6_RUBAR
MAAINFPHKSYNHSSSQTIPANSQSNLNSLISLFFVGSQFNQQVKLTRVNSQTQEIKESRAHQHHRCSCSRAISTQLFTSHHRHQFWAPNPPWKFAPLSTVKPCSHYINPTLHKHKTIALGRSLHPFIIYGHHHRRASSAPTPLLDSVQPCLNLKLLCSIAASLKSTNHLHQQDAPPCFPNHVVASIFTASTAPPLLSPSPTPRMPSAAATVFDPCSL